MNEPLKDKRYLDDNVDGLFWEEDVTSAVKWLKQQINEGKHSNSDIYQSHKIIELIDEAFTDIQ